MQTQKMQTQKMNLANIKGELSRAEMKKIIGGAYFRCTCTAQVGTWTYISMPTTTQLIADINESCLHGGTCVAI